MAAAPFLDLCRFNPTLGGTTDWTYSSAVTGYIDPTTAGAINGAQYSYRAESLTLSQWEVGIGTYNSSTHVFTRTTVLFNSSGTTAKISFTVAPQVAIVALAEDLTKSPGTTVITGLDNTGATDVGAALNAAIQASPTFSVCVLPPGIYQTSVTILVNGGRTLKGYTGGFNDTSKASGVVIRGNLSLAIVVQLYGDGGSASVSLKGLQITRSAGTIPTSCIGLEVWRCNNALVEDCLIFQHYYGIYLFDLNVTVRFNRVMTTAISQTHWFLAAQAIEIYFDQCRCGMNGTSDLAAQSYMTVDGGGWDTIRLLGCQWNQAANTVNYALIFQNFNGTNPNGIFLIDNMHCEMAATAFMGFGGNTARIFRIGISNSQINTAGVFINTAAQLNELNISNCRINPTVTLDQQTTVAMTGCHIYQAFLVNAPTYNVIVGNVFYVGVTLQGIAAKSVFVGNAVLGTLTNTSTGVFTVANNA